MSTNYQSCTYKPELIDNENLLEGQERLENIQEEQKLVTMNLNIISLAIDDAYRHSSSGKRELKIIFIEPEELEQAITLYENFKNLCENYLTMKQLEAIFRYVVQRKRLKDIATEEGVTPAAILKHIRFVQKKVRKNKLQTNLL